MKLKNLTMGQQFRFSQRGMVWVVITATNGQYLSKVIQARSENGTIRTYCGKNKTWHKKVYI